MANGISKEIFLIGLVVTMLGSSILSIVVSMRFAIGPKGDSGPQGPPGVFTVQNMSGWLSAPAYDSGWILLQQNVWHTIQHNLNTTDLFVYVLCKDSTIINQNLFIDQRAVWEIRSKDEIALQVSIDTSTQFRVMLWKIATL